MRGALPDLGDIRAVYDGSLTSDRQVRTFQHSERLFPVREVARGARVLALPHSELTLPTVEFLSGGVRYDLVDTLALNRVTGLLVLKDGAVVREEYALGNTPETRWISMSVAKTITATLIGAAIHEGHIRSIDDPVTHYLAPLRGGAYEGVTIRQILQMTSGVGWDETYTSPVSDRRRMLEAQIARQPGAILALMARLPRVAPAGTVWNYSTGETFIAGALLSAATGRTLSDYLSERIWARVGMESAATWWLESPDGLEIGGSGLAATLRDYGRFALFLLHGGIAGGERILPEGWLAAAAAPQWLGGRRVDYGYMVWPLAAAPGSVNDGAFQAIGIFGQHLYFNPRERVVIVVWGAQPKPNGKAPVSPADFFAAVTSALRDAG
jgi:CubicO group peptidase (beta-lactamase class C family)